MEKKKVCARIFQMLQQFAEVPVQLACGSLRSAYHICFAAAFIEMLADLATIVCYICSYTSFLMTTSTIVISASFQSVSTCESRFFFCQFLLCDLAWSNALALSVSCFGLGQSVRTMTFCPPAMQKVKQQCVKSAGDRENLRLKMR